MNQRITRDDDLLISVSEQTATELEMFCAVRELDYAGEQRHLAPCCAEVVRRVASEYDDPPALAPFAFGAEHGWEALGLVDVVFRWADRLPIFLELKSGDLWPCVWDAVKLATAVLGGNAAAAYLLAGAKRSDWLKRTAGSEFFETAEWDTLGAGVRDRYLSSWRLWEREGHIPGSIPSRFSTVALGAFPLTIGTPWELRLAAVQSTGDWITWPRTVD